MSGLGVNRALLGCERRGASSAFTDCGGVLSGSRGELGGGLTAPGGVTSELGVSRALLRAFELSPVMSGGDGGGASGLGASGDSIPCLSSGGVSGVHSRLPCLGLGGQHVAETVFV